MTSWLIFPLLFVPGIALIYLVGRGRSPFTKLETIVGGSLLWNYIMIMSSALFGAFGALAILPLWVLTIVGGGITCSALFLVSHTISTIRKSGLRPDWGMIFSFSTVFALLIALAIFHPLFYEWDAVSVYLPSGRSVAATGNLFNSYWNSYYPISSSVLLAIVYAWSFTILGEVPALLPITYTVLIAVSVFVISKKLTGSTFPAAASALTFLSVPSLARYLAMDSLLADLPFIFYMTAALLFIILYVQARRPSALLLASLAAVLATLSKPIGFVFMPVVLGIAISLWSNRWPVLRVAVYVFMSTATFLFFIVWNYAFYDRGSTLFFSRTIGPTISIAILSSLLAIIAFKQMKVDLIPPRRKSESLWGILPILPLILFLIQQFLEYGIVLEWGPGLNLGNQLFVLVRSSNSLQLQQLDIWQFVSWYPIVLSIALGAPFVLPILFGLSGCIRKSNVASFLTLSWIIVLIGTWSLFFQDSFQGGEYRRLLYFSPFVSIIVGRGMQSIGTRLRINARNLFYCFAVYCSFVIIYTWSVYFQGYAAGNIISQKNIGVIPDTLAYNLYLAAFIGIILFAWALERIRFPNSLPSVLARVTKGTLLLYILCASLVGVNVAVISPFVRQINSTSWDPHYYSVAKSPTWAEGIFEVVDYYASNITDSYLTLGFRIYYLSLYDNRSIVDLSTSSTYQTVAPILTSKNTSDIIQQYFAHNIRYFLLPKPSAPLAYSVFSRAQNAFPAVALIQQNSRFVLVKEFSNFELYKLLSSGEYVQYVSRLKLLFTFQENPLVISDDNQSSQYIPNVNMGISLSDSTTTKVAGLNALQITIGPYSTDRNPVVRYHFSKAINASAYQYVAFYWYGRNTGLTVSIRMVTNYSSDQFAFDMQDSWTGWARLIIPLSEFKVLIGNPSWISISDFAITVESNSFSTPITFYLDRPTLDVGIDGFFLIKWSLQ